MKLQVSNAIFNANLYLDKRVSNDVIKENYIQYFDNDGFELSFLEQEYYRENNIKLNYFLNHGSNQYEWIRLNDQHFKIDHSLLLQRWGFSGAAKEQLEYKRKEFPQLNKYLKLTPKWGLDFALEYYNNDNWLEVIHIENDYRNFEDAVRSKELLENKILSTDWVDFVKSLIIHKKEWEALTGFAQNDWKARHWGLNKAEITEKAYQ